MRRIWWGLRFWSEEVVLWDVFCKELVGECFRGKELVVLL
jgi:hypothetical protein